MKRAKWQMPITIVFLFMGIMLSLQFQAQNRISSDLSMQRTENLIAMVRGLSDKRQKLSLEINDLDKKLELQLAAERDERKLVSNLKSELEKLEIITGTAPLKGTGIIITFAEYSPILYIDLINISNELWAAGAEAIAINEQRITSRSSIFYGEDRQSMYLTINNNKIEFPITIRAIGDPNNLEKGLSMPGGILDNLAVFKVFPVLENSNSIKIPAIIEEPIYFFMNEYIPPKKPEPDNTPTTPNLSPSTSDQLDDR